MTGYCLICEAEIDVQMCCSGYECGCVGQPINPPVCGGVCYDIYMMGSGIKGQLAKETYNRFKTINADTVSCSLDRDGNIFFSVSINDFSVYADLCFDDETDEFTEMIMTIYWRGECVYATSQSDIETIFIILKNQLSRVSIS